MIVILIPTNTFKFNLIILTFRDLYQTLAQNLPKVFSPAIPTQTPQLALNFPSTSANSALTSVLTPNIPRDQPLNHTDYPNVHFWFRRNWINQKKEMSGITNVNQSNVLTMTKQNKG